MDASEIYSKRLNAKEVIFLHSQNGKLIFPVADGRIKFVEGDQELRTCTLIWEHPIRGEGQRDFLVEVSSGEGRMMRPISGRHDVPKGTTDTPRTGARTLHWTTGLHTP